MRSASHFIVIISLLLGGCYNQSLESDQINIASEKKVRILLGSNSSGRLDRFKGSYMDVVNGGSVKLSYAFAGEAVQTVDMEYDGLNWMTDLKLSVGTYTFSAAAYNSANIMIFDAPASKTHTITPETTNLALGIQLNPIMEEIEGTPMPVITQITKPAGYQSGKDLNLEFTVRGGQNDTLRFKIDVQDNESNSVRNHQLYSNQFDSISGAGTKIYSGSMGVRIPTSIEGKVYVNFSVYSEVLQTTTNAQFVVQSDVELAGSSGSVVFMPQAEFSLGVRENSEANTVAYVVNLTANAGFNDNITFFYDDSTANSIAVHNPDPIDPNMPNKRSGEIYREFMEAGTVNVTFFDNGTMSTDDKFSITYNFEVPSGSLTTFSTVSHVDLDVMAPEITSISLNSSTVSLGGSIEVKIKTSFDGEETINLNLNARASEDNNYDDSRSSNYISLNGPVNSFGEFTGNLTVKNWQAPGSWIIQSFEVRENYNNRTYYSYRPDNNTTHYVKSSDTYNKYNDTWNWETEVSDIRILSFTVSGDYNPDVNVPEITNISIPDATDGITAGDNFTILIEATDNVSGICSSNLTIEPSSDDISGKYSHDSKRIYASWEIPEQMNRISTTYYDYYYGHSYSNPCEGIGLDSSIGATSIASQLTLEKWHVPGEWALEYFAVRDRAGRSNSYFYRPDKSETHYVRSYQRYNSSSESFDYISYEETNLPVLKFVLGGEHIPDLSSPEITSIALASDTTFIGDNATVFIEANDNVSGIDYINISASSVEYSSDSNNYNYTNIAVDNITSGTITAEAQLNFGTSGDDPHMYSPYMYDPYMCMYDPYMCGNRDYSTGEWIINNINVRDHSGRNVNYSYRSNESESHYVKNYSKYDVLSDSWNYVSNEETTLPILRFSLDPNTTTTN